MRMENFICKYHLCKLLNLYFPLLEPGMKVGRIFLQHKVVQADGIDPHTAYQEHLCVPRHR